MPILTNLSSRIKDDAAWYDSYKMNLRKAREIAYRMPLVHVSGNSSRVSFLQLITSPSEEIPTSADVYGYCSDETRAAETMLELPQCVYFYAGRSHPAFGKIALAFDEKCERHHSGSATPFDTGGLASRPEGKIKTALPNHKPETIRRFTKASTKSLQVWREVFVHFLAAYFSRPVEYWEGRPFKADPEELMSRNDDWRAWVFEVRFYGGQKITDAVAWCASRGQREILRREALAHPPVGAVRSPLQRLLEEIHEISPPGTPFYCDELERWVREKVGV
jgi:hypothetical protein